MCGGETFCSIRQIRICLQGKCVFLHCRVNLQQGGRFRASKAAQSRRGKRKMAFPPDPLLLFWSWLSGCNAGRLWLLRVALNFRLRGSNPEQNRRTGSFAT